MSDHRSTRGEVAFADRLVGYRIHPRLGAAPHPVYSLHDAATLLLTPFVHLDLDQLGDWVERHFGEIELARAIREIARRDDPPARRALAAAEAMVARISAK